MKYKINIRKALLLSAVGIGLTFSSCTDDFEQLNTNPKSPKELAAEDTKYQLANVQYNYAFQYLQISRVDNPSNVLVQHLTQTTYVDVSQYNFASNAGDQFYTNWIRKANDLQSIISNAELNKESLSAGQYGYIKGIALAHFVFGMQNVTDHFGPIPYTNAFRAIDGTEFFSPSYDSQELVYDNLLSDINEAITLLTAANEEGVNMYESSDRIYGGSASSWLKFANSMKIRVAARMLDIKESAALTAIEEAAAAGAIASNADNADFPFGDDNYQPIADEHRNRTDYVVSETMIDRLIELSDPRLSAYASPNNAGDYVGGVNGTTNSADETSTVAANLKSDPSFPATFIQYAEVEFILAEVAARKGDAATAKAHYDKAIEASMNKWGITDAAAIADYIASEGVAWDGTGNYKEAIGEQKWLALYMQSHEAWAEYRRLDYPMLERAVGATVDVPVRIFYPSNESTANAVNYAEGVQMLNGADDSQTKLWWDVN
ncbi:SusD/RagB family nutrient-binding outer membrane lipoprotein [Aureibacter tunicatorum]|uniref:SusD/RagB family nutrient-binding outer membrane lipoprotein n=1 Tax=Aureibacter tunicatorum TaxID=866807 RepID=A0AAE3XKH7_9BACT|nr:SusD/RagB family nutrient-binding outer membrane lipoprotein [Aureibacter tunicatorum]MDR6237668.1 hypothetical protein [Aureibacter tunicatorum]BDD02703.1 hypothetical protein AUTU_01860 [Aureibacter tunicatorum]